MPTLGELLDTKTRDELVKRATPKDSDDYLGYHQRTPETYYQIWSPFKSRPDRRDKT